MKMPSRPIFPPPLPPLDRQRRVETVETKISAIFEAAVLQLGEDEARRIFDRVSRKPKRGAGKVLDPYRDQILLKAYDDTRESGMSVAALARQLRERGTTLGNTARAIETHIHKIVKERKERDLKITLQNRYQRMATRNLPPTLLSVARKK